MIKKYYYPCVLSRFIENPFVRLYLHTLKSLKKQNIYHKLSHQLSHITYTFIYLIYQLHIHTLTMDGGDDMNVDRMVARNGTKGTVDKDGNLTSADYYFDSYAHFGIHEEMLKDEVRTNSYRWAIERNPHLFKDKIVLDVGCGTGILSMFAARAGAKHVYGIECSGIVDVARKIVANNGLEDKVTLIQGKVEEVTLPVEKVDIIISEWMGYALLYESMLDTVIYARDQWLVEGGLVFPDKSTLYMCMIEDSDYKSQKIDWWKNVYGFDMSIVSEMAMAEPLVDTVDAASIVTNHCPLITIDISTVKKEDLAFQVPFKLTATQTDYAHAFVMWFDIEFSKCHKPIYFGTGPHHRYTHWKQTVFYFDGEMTLNNNETVEGMVTCKPNESNHRDLDFKLEYTHEGEIQKSGENTYVMR
ncbi:hypothetical protein SARC_11030 [Sphaeroforma arctica JP610]|uniref:Uncharacterized protein n=1 Tax=Sphaeroforma arctica JP610 TaxID=667725 RepID=A0A0L0FJ27_9EUKA|nr:hypothetical protein SARC_11030 [Sphaeroforma arctica JP610]KNC76471.1 hypothetical protein SARC_11030 [Sphaeroforma arctica JP610]|eukprot:XP_014150373.1 hypothetical protein SARC_11030 [Sphaeroforma arctica JP610]